MDDKNIKELLISLGNSFDEKVRESNADLILKVRAMIEKDPKGFWDNLEYAQIEFNSAVCEAVNVPVGKGAGIIQHMVSGIYQHFLEKYFEAVEGFACCADKARFVFRTTLKAILSKENLSLYADYTGTRLEKSNPDEQAYWSPETIPDTKTAIRLFWDWYYLRVDIGEDIGRKS